MSNEIELELARLKSSGVVGERTAQIYLSELRNQSILDFPRRVDQEQEQNKN